MRNVIVAMAFAASILTVALVLKSNGANEGTVWGVVMGLATAAMFSLRDERSCKGRLS